MTKPLAPVTVSGYSDDSLVINAPHLNISETLDCFDRVCVAIFIAPNGEMLKVSGYFSYKGEWKLDVFSNEHNWKVQVTASPNDEKNPVLLISAPEGTVLVSRSESHPRI